MQTRFSGSTERLTRQMEIGTMWGQESASHVSPFLALAGPWANICAGKSSNEIRTCDSHGCGQYTAQRYVWGFTNNHTPLGLLTSLLSALALHFLKCSWPSPSDSRKTRRWNQFHDCLWSKFLPLTSKNSASTRGSEVETAWNKEKRKRSKHTVFPQMFSHSDLFRQVFPRWKSNITILFHRGGTWMEVPKG